MKLYLSLFCFLILCTSNVHGQEKINRLKRPTQEYIEQRIRFILGTLLNTIKQKKLATNIKNILERVLYLHRVELEIDKCIYCFVPRIVANLPEKNLFQRYFDEIHTEIKQRHNQNLPLCPSDIDILRNTENISFLYFCRCRTDYRFIPFIHNVLKKERKLQENGFSTWYHAQNKEQLLPTQLYSLLYSCRTGTPLNNFTFMNLEKDPRIHSHATVESQLRKHIISKKAPVLYLTNTLFSNTQIPYSQPFPTLFVENYNYLGTHKVVNPYHAFELSGYAHLYDEFAQEVEALQKEYTEKVSEHGTLYLIAYPKEHVHKCLYPSNWAGRLSGGVSKGNSSSKTTDMQEIVSIIDTQGSVDSWEERSQFCAIITWDTYGLQNPESGAQMFPFIIPKDEILYQKWVRKWDALFEKVKKRIQEIKLAERITNQRFIKRS